MKSSSNWGNESVHKSASPACWHPWHVQQWSASQIFHDQYAFIFPCCAFDLTSLLRPAKHLNCSRLMVSNHFNQSYQTLFQYHTSKQTSIKNTTWYWGHDLRGYCTSGPYFWRFCAFSQKIKQPRTKYPMDLVWNVPRNSKITILLQCRQLLWSYSEKCAKINIFHVLSHKSITTWVSETPVQ